MQPELPKTVFWTLGLAYDSFSQDYFQEIDGNTNFGVSKLSPKYGVQWNISRDVRVRLAHFRTVKAPLIADRTIQPTQVAGFNQFFDDANGTDMRLYAAGVDVALTGSVDVGVAATRRSFSEPFLESTVAGDRVTLGNRNEDFHRAYAYWTPDVEWVLKAEIQYDRYEREVERQFAIPEEVAAYAFPVSISHFKRSGFFSALSGTLVHQDVERPAASTGPEGNNTFFVVDVSAGWRLPRRGGLLSFQVRNLLDTHTNFQDDSYREFRDAFGDQTEPATIIFIPERQFFATATLNF